MCSPTRATGRAPSSPTWRRCVRVCGHVRGCVGAWVRGGRGCVGAWVRGCGAWRVGRAPHVHVHAHRTHTARTQITLTRTLLPSTLLPSTLLSPARRRRTSSPTRRRSRCSTRWWTRCSKVSTWRGGASCRTRSCACSTRHRRPSDEGAAVLYSCSRRCELRTVTIFESHFPKRRSELRAELWRFGFARF